MVTVNKEKLKALAAKINGHMKAIAADLRFYGETGLQRGEFEKALKRIEISTDKTEQEIKQFVESQRISYADLVWFAYTAAYRRFPNQVEVNLLYHGMREMLQIAAIKNTTADKLWPHLAK